ncbi:dihydrolipoamide acetyltransferase family protein [Subtercola frigoramans]|uniref:Dihydrolipoamide acetyltransferase component of pyruvate dehydrogenase complex n=1 Tax=Subtercola frigoramans TaxID=120298 RepID=A0ABS2L002_9MICO|nr:dihydrolipoamide acetyltransferase family protein [Subtercola frigoramans]MBM7470407.1 pyruvate dehydrogenase E2 component (dihydrolipoamide acetyltransferase) [Subtercola frigoramans]
MSESLFHLPDVGEGLTEAEIVSWRVKPGDTIEINQVIVEIETAKSLVELPSPYEGVVRELLVLEGTTVEVGAPIIRVFGTDAGSVGPAAGAPEVSATVAPVPASAVDADVAQSVSDAASTVSNDEAPGAVLVGYGTKGHVSSRRRPRGVSGAGNAVGGGAPVGGSPASTGPRPPATAGAASPAPSAAAASATAATPVATRPVGHSSPAITGLPVIAKPPIRKLAKDLDVILTEVTPTGPIGDITRDDVIRHASQAKVFHNIETPQWADEREERIPVKGVRKHIAKSMVASAFTAPHVSLFVDVDATRTMEFVKRLKTSADFAGVKVSPLLIIAKAIIWAVRRNPMVNSAWTDKEIIVRNYVNLGVAAATPRGLLVPNVKEAQSMTLLQLAGALESLTLTAREGRTSPADMADGTITITNIGVFGMDTGTPILNPGEVAIIALGTIKQRPWVVDGEVRPRFVTTLGASFDHRVVDGDVASRFLADVAAIVEEPALLLD